MICNDAHVDVTHRKTSHFKIESFFLNIHIIIDVRIFSRAKSMLFDQTQLLNVAWSGAFTSHLRRVLERNQLLNRS